MQTDSQLHDLIALTNQQISFVKHHKHQAKRAERNSLCAKSNILF